MCIEDIHSDILEADLWRELQQLGCLIWELAKAHVQWRQSDMVMEVEMYRGEYITSFIHQLHMEADFCQMLYEESGNTHDTCPYPMGMYNTHENYKYNV